METREENTKKICERNFIKVYQDQPYREWLFVAKPFTTKVAALPRGGHWGFAVLRCWTFFQALNKISACGVAVFLNLTVCDVCVLKSAVFGETKLSAVSQFPF